MATVHECCSLIGWDVLEGMGAKAIVQAIGGMQFSLPTGGLLIVSETEPGLWMVQRSTGQHLQGAKHVITTESLPSEVLWAAMSDLPWPREAEEV